MIFFRYGRKFKFGKRTEPVKENNGGFCIFRTKQPSVQAETVTAFNKNILRRQMFYKSAPLRISGRYFSFYVKRFCAVFRKNIRKFIGATDCYVKCGRDENCINKEDKQQYSGDYIKNQNGITFLFKSVSFPCSAREKYENGEYFKSAGEHIKYEYKL